jgi:hypothetical protein
MFGGKPSNIYDTFVTAMGGALGCPPNAAMTNPFTRELCEFGH